MRRSRGDDGEDDGEARGGQETGEVAAGDTSRGGSEEGQTGPVWINSFHFAF